MGTRVCLQDVSVCFTQHQKYAAGIKETVMRLLSPPNWYKKNPRQKTGLWGLKDINLNINEGDRLGIIGRNGAGKSTLLKVISQIYYPTEGSLQVNGRLVPLIEIGAGFNPELTGRENSYLNGAILGIPRKVITKHMDDIMAFSELEDFVDVPVKYYSTGMYMKLAFTLATEVAPDILILDELYAAGDAAFITKANTRLDKFVSKSKILILVAHNMDYIKRFCNRVIVLDHGKMLGAGEPQDMVDRYLSLSQGNTHAFDDLKAPSLEAPVPHLPVTEAPVLDVPSTPTPETT